MYHSSAMSWTMAATRVSIVWCNCKRVRQSVDSKYWDQGRATRATRLERTNESGFPSAGCAGIDFGVNRAELHRELLQGYERTAGREQLTPMEKYRVKAIDPKYAAVKGKREAEKRCCTARNILVKRSEFVRLAMT
jgi:hypothetical protein